jgi:primosomal protein N' (replication factor Y)
MPLVGIVSLDALLYQPDFKIEEECARIVERLISLSDKSLILQTFFPNSKAVSWTREGKETFFKKALAEREKFNYPPFSSLIKLSLSHKNQKIATKEAYDLKKKLDEQIVKYNIKNSEIIGPSPAFIEKVKEKYTWKILIKLETKNKKIKAALLGRVPPSWRVDVDPEKII